MILTGEDVSTRRKSCSTATLSTTNLTWTTMVSKPGHHTERLVGQPEGVSVPSPSQCTLSPHLIKEPAPLLVIVMSRLAATRLLFSPPPSDCVMQHYKAKRDLKAE